MALAESPDRADAPDDFVAEQFAHQFFLGLVAGRQHDQVGWYRFAAVHLGAGGGEGFDIGKLPERNLAFHDQVGATDIEVIAAAARQIFELPAGIALAEVELESDAREPFEQFLVELFRLLGHHGVALARQRQRHRGRNQIVVVERSLVVGRVDKLGRWFDRDDQGRTALHDRHFSAARIEVLRDVVTAVAGADHDRALAFPVLAIVILARVHDLAGEIFQAGNLRQIRYAADAGREHHMPRTHGPPDAGAAQRHGPAAFVLVVTAALEFGPGPEVQLHGLDIGLEPVGELVLGDVGRPVRREQHVGQVVDLHLVVQRQRMIALAPVVADA